MFKIIKKAFLLSFFAFSSCVFPSALAMRRIAQVAVARTLNQSAPFHHSLTVRFPFDFERVMEQVMVQETTEVETQKKVMVATESVDASVVRNYETRQNVTTDNQVLVAVDRDNKIHCYAHLHPKSASSYWQSSSPNEMINERFANQKKQAEQHMSQIAYKAKIEAEVKSIVAEEKKQLCSEISKLSTKTQNMPFLQSKTSECMKNYSSCSNDELQKIKGKQAQDLFQREKELNSLIVRNYKVAGFINAEKNVSNFKDCESIRCNIKKTMSLQDLYELRNALQLQVEIQKLKTEIQSIDHTLQQKVQAFENQLKIESSKEIKKIITELVVKEKALVDSVVELKQKLHDQQSKLANLHAQLESCRNRSAWTKLWEGNHEQEKLKTEYEKVKAAQRNTRQELQVLENQLPEIEKKITQAQNILVKKQIAEREALLLEQKQAKEALISYNQFIQSQHEAYIFDITNCPECVLGERQDALFNTMDQGYVQFDQKFDLSPQVLGFLAAHGIDPQEFQNCFGTALQQQLHKEMCAILSQTALLQAEFAYQSDLVNSIVSCADAAHDANESGQIKIVESLNNLSFALLEYGQSIVTGTRLGLKGIAHSISNLDQTAESVGKAVYYVLESVVIGNYTGSNDACIQFREQRKAEIIAGLQNLGHAIENLTGPQKVQALTQFLVEWYGAENISKVIGGVCGIAESAAVKGANCVKSEIDVSKSVQAVVAIAGDSIGSQKIGSDIAKIAQKMEQIGQEKIVQNVAQELEIAMQKTNSSLSVRCKILTAAEVVTEIKKVGGKISARFDIPKNVALFNNTKYWLEQICTKINTKIENTLLEQYNKMTLIPGTKMSLCIDLEHIINVEYKLIEDASRAYLTVQFTGGHLAGTMSKLAQEGLVKIKSFVEFGGGCKEYLVEDLFTGREFTHTEFPPHWNIEKIAQKTKCLVENAMANGSLTEQTKTAVKVMTNEGFNLKIVTDSAPEVHNCAAIENTVNRHIVTSYPYKG